VDLTSSGPSARERRTFPLVPLRRRTGLAFGDQPGRRRGQGSEVITYRPYEPGDPVSTIDWAATARLSTATGSDAFIVRSKAVDEAPRVVLVLDRRPAMKLYPRGLPWFAKADAVAGAAAAIVHSAEAVRADVGAIDVAAGEERWLAPARRGRGALILDRVEATDFDAPVDTLERSLWFIGRRANLPAGTFVFVLSDFLAPPPLESWLDAIAHRWDLVPVVAQDPLWERSFPPLGGVELAVEDPAGGRPGSIRLTRRQAHALRDEHERRFATLLSDFTSLGLDPVIIDSADPDAIGDAFSAWADERRRVRWAR
jgi:uncharacterized protein (DUF58 family)